jgi:hypothetical protein
MTRGLPGRRQITTAVGSGKGAGGNITIDPEFVILEGCQKQSLVRLDERKINGLQG